MPTAAADRCCLWKAYFPRARIHGLDLADGTPHEQRRIKTWKGDQSDVQFLRSVAEQIGPLDIIIDDGSHRNDHMLISFGAMFPYLKTGGFYAIEDTETSYAPDYGGDPEDLNNPATSLGYFKQRLDGLNYEERENYQPSELDRQISAIHFYHNLIIVEKNPNCEGSIRFRNAVPHAIAA